MFKTIDELEKMVKDEKIYFECDIESDDLIDNDFNGLCELIINKHFSNFSNEVEEGTLSFDVGFIELLQVNRDSETVTIKVTVYVEFY